MDMKRMKSEVSKNAALIICGFLIGMQPMLTQNAMAMTTTECLSCHTPVPPATVSSMHHALSKDCIYCHKLTSSTNGGYTVEVQKDCTVCHGMVGHEAAHDKAKPNSAECNKCHNANVVVEHANRGLNCGTCHNSSDPKVMAAIAKGKDTTGQDVFCHDCHGSVNHHSQSSCNVCHVQTGDKPLKEKCFQCHGDIMAKYNASNDTFAGLSVKQGFYATSNTKHDIECYNCHNTHVNGSIIDPDNKSTAFTATIKHPGTGAAVMDSSTFCLKCHDSTKPTGGTTVPTMRNIAATYINSGTQSEQHGAGKGSGRGVLRGPYAAVEWSSNESGVPIMPCLDCHDTHAGNGLYLLKTLTDQFGNPITLTSANFKTNSVSRWCSQCHTNPMNQLDTSKVGCITSSCHSHGNSSW